MWYGEKEPKTNKAMKELIFSLALLVCSFKAFSQQTLAWYGFDDSTPSPTYVDNTLVTASNLTAVGVTVTGYGAGVAGIPDLGIYSNQWPTSSINAGKYCQVTVTVQPGKTVVINQLRLRTSYTINGPSSLALRTDFGGDNFNTNIYTGPNLSYPSWSYHTFGLLFPALSSGESISFRMYAFGGNGIGRWVVDSLFVVGYEPSTLPIELTSFAGKSMGDDVDLTWQTATEHDNSHFTIFRSTDGEEWSEVGRVAGAGNSQSATSYAFQDILAPQGTLFYRLRQTDFDGEYEESWVIAVEHSRSVMVSRPVGSVVSLEGRRFAVFDQSGRILASTVVSFTLPQEGVFILVSDDGTRAKVLSY